MAESPDIESLARRFLDLWQEQLAAMAADPELATATDRLIAALNPVWPSANGNGGSTADDTPPAEPPAASGTAPADDASGARGDELRGLERRLAALEKRLAELESGAT